MATPVDATEHDRVAAALDLEDVAAAVGRDQLQHEEPRLPPGTTRAMSARTA